MKTASINGRRSRAWLLAMLFGLTLTGPACSYFRTGDLSYQELEQRNREAAEEKNMRSARKIPVDQK